MFTLLCSRRCGFSAGVGGRWTVFLLLGLSVPVKAAPTAEAPPAGQQFPRTVSVQARHTYLRSGPGDDFYPTARLIQGEAVELWSVDAAGYGAVRPLTGSFSWLRAADVDRQIEADPSVGVVVTDGAVARIGSQINELRHVAQVRLEAGERVRVLDEVRIDQGRHAGLWVKIAPPSGEFRWARLADLDLPVGLAPQTDELVAAAVGSGELAANIAQAREAVDAWREAGESLSQVIAAAGELPLAEPEPAEPARLGSITGAHRLLADWMPVGSGLFDLTPPQPASSPTTGPLAAPADELSDIDLALSLAVTGPAATWQLEPLRERLRLAAARASTGTDRLRAEAIDARLARFETIKGRHLALAARDKVDPSPLQLGSLWSSLGGIGSRPIRPGVFPGGKPADGQTTWTPPDYVETSGRLATVISRRPDAPRWAIVDANNNVLAFVAPSAGVNLAPMVGQQVSVRGSKGYMPEYKRPYVVASEARPRMAAAVTPGTR
jgi:uncharacterized protein YgiM (DUF1202 family)